MKKLKTMMTLWNEENGQENRCFKMFSKVLWVFVLSFLLGLGSLGCRTLPDKAAEEGISYHLGQDVEITKLTFYLKVPRDLPYPVCWVDVSIRNLSDSEQSFLVLVQVDDEPGIALRTKKLVGPKKEETLSLITMGKSLPRRFSVTVTH
ncbi:MAG: hypothetical protein HY882_07555 [Deltaproteobacteria bacterium]|nr:hypothetical protein [Deltaproteobacteria bacterium]